MGDDGVPLGKGPPYNSSRSAAVAAIAAGNSTDLSSCSKVPPPPPEAKENAATFAGECAPSHERGGYSGASGRGGPIAEKEGREAPAASIPMPGDSYNSRRRMLWAGGSGGRNAVGGGGMNEFDRRDKDPALRLHHQGQAESVEAGLGSGSSALMGVGSLHATGATAATLAGEHRGSGRGRGVVGVMQDGDQSWQDHFGGGSSIGGRRATGRDGGGGGGDFGGRGRVEEEDGGGGGYGDDCDELFERDLQKAVAMLDTGDFTLNVNGDDEMAGRGAWTRSGCLFDGDRGGGRGEGRGKTMESVASSAAARIGSGITENAHGRSEAAANKVIMDSSAGVDGWGVVGSRRGGQRKSYGDDDGREPVVGSVVGGGGGGGGRGRVSQRKNSFIFSETSTTGSVGGEGRREGEGVLGMC